jgi:hypothetical protein
MTRILPILFILIAIGLFFFYIEPTWNGPIAQAKQQVASYDSALAAASTFTQKENQLLAEQNSIPAASLSRLETYLPDGVNNVQLILDLNSLAQKSGVSLANFDVENNAAQQEAGAGGATTPAVGGLPQSTSAVNSLTLSVSATGTYQAFRTFLAASEQSLRQMDVTSLQVSNSSTGVYTYTITYRIYWLH